MPASAWAARRHWPCWLAWSSPADVVRGHRCFATGICRSPCPGHFALAHGGDGVGAIILGGAVRYRRGHAGDFRARLRRQLRWRACAAAAGIVHRRQRPDNGDGPGVRPGRAALAAAGRTDYVVALRGPWACRRRNERWKRVTWSGPLAPATQKRP